MKKEIYFINIAYWEVKKMKNNLAILMSTFNGSKYIREQLDSLYNQTIDSFDLYIRDDCSNDDTINILNEYSSKHNNITIIEGNINLKPARSFMELIKKIDGYEYYAFCDQDDVWHKDKLLFALESLKNITIPALYCSNYQLTDAQLNNLPDNGHKSSSDFYTSIIYSNATGCTVVFNNLLMKYLKMYNPKYIVMHDDWAHKVCLSIGGKVIYDERKTIFYRQHGDNADGGVHSITHKIKKMLTRIKNKDCIRSKQLYELFLGYNYYMTNDKIELLKNFDNYSKNRIKKKKIIKNNNLKILDKKKYKKFIFSIKHNFF